MYEAPRGEQVPGESYLSRPTSQVTRSAVNWLDRRAGTEPFFLWTHYFDPHAPNDPAQEYLDLAEGNSYLAEVAALDRFVGDLLNRLRAEPDYDEMTIVVVADHGESLGRHGEPTHGLLVYDATIHVPFFVRFPGARRATERSADVVSVVDVCPTLLEGIGLGPPGGDDGLSLFDRGGVPGDRGVYYEGYTGFLNFGWSPLCGWADASGIYIHGPRPELYATGDVRQQVDLFQPEDPRVLRARRAIERLAQRSTLPREEDETRAMADQARMQALGYAGAASVSTAIPHPLAPTTRPSPNDRLEEYYRVLEAPLITAAGKRDEAIRSLELGRPRDVAHE